MQAPHPRGAGLIILNVRYLSLAMVGFFGRNSLAETKNEWDIDESLRLRD